jgi:peptidyl-dipeptidase A
MRVFARSLLLSLPLLLLACGQDRGSGQAGTSDAAVEEVRSFVAASEAELAAHWEYANRVFWIQANFISDDTNWLASRVGAESSELMVRLADGARRYADLELPDELARKLDLLRTLVTLPAPSTPGAAVELAELRTGLETAYATGRFDHRGGSLDLPALERIIDSSRDPEELAEVWTGWRTVAAPMADGYARMVEIANAGALGSSASPMSPTCGWRLRDGTLPRCSPRRSACGSRSSRLYEQLHCDVRDRVERLLRRRVQPRAGPIRADLLGNMWAQQWLNIYDIVALDDAATASISRAILVEREYTPRAMTETGEAFFVSLGIRAAARDVLVALAVHSAAPTAMSSVTRRPGRSTPSRSAHQDVHDGQRRGFSDVHHELGHNFYQRAYADRDFTVSGRRPRRLP